MNKLGWPIAHVIGLALNSGAVGMNLNSGSPYWWIAAYNAGAAGIIGWALVREIEP